MKTANELHAIADAANAAKEEARKARAKERAEAKKARAKERAEEMALKCEIKAQEGEHHCEFNRCYNRAHEALIIDELKAHNYEVTIEDCQLIIRW